MRYAILAALLSSCSAPVRCEFPVWVSVMPSEEAEDECRRLGVRWTDSGKAITNQMRILGCAPKDRIVTNGTESNAGHELKHHIDRNCRRSK